VAEAEAESRRDAARRDCDAAQAQLDALGDVDAQHARALAAAASEAARGKDPALGDRVAEITQRIGELTARARQVSSALVAGRTALRLLEEAQEKLDSAGGWSTWDAFGGGMLSDAAKYSKLEQASRLLYQADASLAAFSRDLSHVGMTAVAGARVDSMTRAFDVLCDNIFADLAVRTEVKASARRVAQATEQVRKALPILEQRAQQIATDLRDLPAERDRMLLG